MAPLGFVGGASALHTWRATASPAVSQLPPRAFVGMPLAQKKAVRPYTRPSAPGMSLHGPGAAGQDEDPMWASNATNADDATSSSSSSSTQGWADCSESEVVGQQPAQGENNMQWVKSATRTAAAAAGIALSAFLAPLAGSFVGNKQVRFHNPPMIAEPAIAAAKFSKKSVAEKLAQVPVFAVTNASGQPYLANMDGSGSQIGLIFFSHEDALNMLKDMQKNPGASDARVYIMGLDKAYEMVKSKPTPSGIRGPSGQELTMVFRFFPDSKQVKLAENLLRKMRIRQPVEGVPVFVAKGLTLRKGAENVIPLFLTKEDLDAAWEKLRDSNKDLPSTASVEVGNLLFIISQMEKGEHPGLQNLGFFAPRASVEYVTKEQAGPTGQARMHHNPVAGAAK